MLALSDCIALADLTDEEVEQHETLPPITTGELALYVVHWHHGGPMMKSKFVDDIKQAKRFGDRTELLRLYGVLRLFIATHPELQC